MSTMILCRDKVAHNPLYISDSDIRLYTEQELCYYIYNNIYILNNDFVNDELIHFLREETADVALADRVGQMKENNESLAVILVTILKSVDYYSESEIDKISAMLNTLDNQSAHERLRSRADTYLEREDYYKAIDDYRYIIKEYSNEATGAFISRIYHNLGVAYARMFLYSQAADSFKAAYDIGQYAESYQCYIAAKWFVDKNSGPVREDVPEEEYVVRRRIESLMDNARYQDEYRKSDELATRKEQGDAAYYHKAVNAMLGEWKKDYCKYTAR